MTIGSISGTSNTSSLSGSASTIAGNFDTFMQLLTTQLRNQNPLDPLDTNQFTEQLVQFSSVEQQLKTNQFLEALILSSQTATTTQATSFIGKEVSASTTLANLKDSEASWYYNMDERAEKAFVTILDSDGDTVYAEELGALESGEGRFDWDGVGSSGETEPDGAYQIRIDAQDEFGNPIAATTEMVGTVDGVDFSGDEPFLVIGKAYIALSSVNRVNQPA
ncbi:MAG: flagellar hook assembly protein FlgD [Alphaproteobacteria bacterium]|nr:flagellar hook assembly protein FlgD [Alphaproteobacteria bacterium]